MKLKLFLSLVVSVLLGACERGNKVTEFPLVGASNTTNLVFEKVELTDTATVLTVRAFNYPNNWIKVAPYTHLAAQGKKYELLGSKDIKIDEKIFMPEDGDSCFMLLFKPLPKGCTSFDYIEGDAESDWRIYDIDLTGKRDANRPADLPKTLKKSPAKDKPTPQYSYTIGESVVNIHLLGYRKGVCSEIAISINSPFEGEQNINVQINPTTGKGSTNIRLYGTAEILPIVNGFGYGKCFIAPNENVDLYINLAYINRPLRQRYIYKEKIKLPCINGCWSDGSIYDEITNLRATDDIVLSDSLLARKYAHYAMTADEFTEGLVQFYYDICDYVDAQKWHPWEKEKMKAECFNNFLYLLNIDVRQYFPRETHIHADYQHDPILSKHYERLFACVDLNNPWLLFDSQSKEVLTAAHCVESDTCDENLMYWGSIREALKKAYTNSLSDEDLQTMRQWRNTFYADMCEDIRNRVKGVFATRSMNLINVENIAPEVLLQAIIAPHKGKVILIDFWNTWCGPCRNALKTIEPYKTNELSSKDIVWIYIADESSPINTYSEMIRGIKGIHYQVNKAQWDYLTNKIFDIDGIPSYVLVDKDGNYSLRNDFRHHTKMVNTLKEEVKRMPKKISH